MLVTNTSDAPERAKAPRGSAPPLPTLRRERRAAAATSFEKGASPRLGQPAGQEVANRGRLGGDECLGLGLGLGLRLGLGPGLGLGLGLGLRLGLTLVGTLFKR